MSHTIRDKKKLLHRIRRIRGQVNAIEKTLLEDEHDCSAILQTIAACRGAMNGLMVEVLEGHVNLHVLNPHPSKNQVDATKELIEVIRTYLK